MAISDRVYSSEEEFTSEGIQWDIYYVRCGAHEESINHVFFNVLQHSRFGLSRRYHQIQLFFQQALSSQTWIIYSGEFSRRWKIISLHGYNGTFGKVGIIKFSVFWI